MCQCFHRGDLKRAPAYSPRARGAARGRGGQQGRARSAPSAPPAPGSTAAREEGASSRDQSPAELWPGHRVLDLERHPGVPQSANPPMDNQEASGSAERLLARTGLMGREISRLGCSPKPLPARSQPERCKHQGRAKQKSLSRFNMQSPGSSIKQQKLNVISSRGTAAALAKQNRSRLTACHLWETPGSLGKG